MIVDADAVAVEVAAAAAAELYRIGRYGREVILLLTLMWLLTPLRCKRLLTIKLAIFVNM